MTRSASLFTILLLLCASSLSALTVTSVTPDRGWTGGGTEVTVRGTGFETCSICSPAFPPVVLIGGVPATVTLASSDSITAITPPHFPGPTSVTVALWNGSSETLPDGFTYEGEFPEQAFERILVPLFTAPVQGAFGSIFRTELWLANKGLVDPLRIHGLEPVCDLSTCVPFDLHFPIELGRPQSMLIAPGEVIKPGTPGRFLHVPTSQVHSLAMNLRVHDTTRSALNFGTEIPVVREREFVKDRILLTGVPGDSRFRNTLRVYATAPMTVEVKFGDLPQVERIHLTAGENDFSPAYAQFGTFPVIEGTYPVTISAEVCNLGAPCPGIGETDFWAFISVTNNETQLISTITPQP